jgi:hypothetical protein
VSVHARGPRRPSRLSPSGEDARRAAAIAARGESCPGAARNGRHTRRARGRGGSKRRDCHGHHRHFL